MRTWYDLFKQEIPQTEGELRKALKADAKKVLEKAMKVIDKRDRERIEVAENERKLIDKARKWGQMVVDCERVVKGGRTQTEVDFDRIYDLKSEIEKIKTQKVIMMKQRKEESEKHRKWKQDKVKEIMQIRAVNLKQDREIQILKRENKKKE